MLSLTRKTHYGLIAMAYLAERPGTLCSARQIANEFKLPLPVLMNILKSLHHKGLLESSRGAQGGYRLAIRPAELPLARLIDAIEGPSRFECHSQTDDGCRAGVCPIRGSVQNLHRKLNEFLEHATLAEILTPTENAAVGAGIDSSNFAKTQSSDSPAESV